MNIITIIVPCYNEQESLKYFYDEVCKVKSQFPSSVSLDFIFVNDGSSDNTLAEIKKLVERDKSVHYISFSRNFGKESAIYAGLRKSKGDYTVIMDADLQDPPSLLPEMYRLVSEENYDSVATRRVSRKGEPPIRSFFARTFYKLMNKISQTDIVDGARDYRLMNRKFVNALLSLKEYNRFSKGLFGWVGFKTKWLEFENVERVAGETKWSFWKLFKYAIEGIVAFSTAPLVLSSFLGILCCIISVFFTVFVVISKMVLGNPVVGWASTMCVILFIGGIQLLCIGVLGEYLSKIYLV